MKRLNPKTGKPFKRGEKGKKGLVFIQYQCSRKLINGYYKEHWSTQENLEKYRLSAYDTKRSMYGTEAHALNKDGLRKYSKKYYASPMGRAKSLLKSAKKRGAVLISAEWVAEKIKKGICEFTGLKFDLNQCDFHHNPYSPSLDRKNPRVREYTEENTRVVLTAVNNSLNQYGETVMLPILKAMVKATNKNAKPK